jgi:predicted dehydrogenase
MKIGVLGFAHGHVGMYCRRWRAEPGLGIKPVAGWDHDAKRAAGAREAHGVTLYDSAEALLADAGVEGVVIAAETSLHAALVEQAARAGKRIVLQKPISLTMDEADRIVEAVSSSGVPFSMAWQMRVDPENLKIRELLTSGRFGRIFMLRRRHGLATQCMKDFDTLWHVVPALNRDIWADDAAHPMDFVYWLLGMPSSVTAELASRLNPKVPNDNGIAIFRYADGTIAEVCCSFVCRAHENTTEIVAERGTIVQTHGDAPSSGAPRPAGTSTLRWFHQDKGAWEQSEVPGMKTQGDRISNLAGPLAAFFGGQRPPIATAGEGRDVLRMMLATYESHEAGRRVDLASRAPAEKRR